MNFAAQPPEITSTLMYCGPGSGPFLAAAAAWDGVGAQLRATAAGFESIVSSLTGQVWLGPSSQAMAVAAAPHVTWLNTTAAQVEQAATQVRVAAAAYEGAFAMTVPPSVVAANRAQLAMLVGTNILGQNTWAIAATEGLYAEMWAQDAAAMYGYSAAAATAMQLTPFSPPPQTTDPAALGDQAAAVAEDGGNSAGSVAQQALSQLNSPLTQDASVAAAAPAAEGEAIDLLGLNAIAVASLAATAVGLALSAGAWVSADASTRFILDDQDELREVQQDILNAIDLYSPLTPSRPSGHVPLPAMSAAVGEAVSAGDLSVPISWAVKAPEIRSLAYTTPVAAAPAASMGGVGAAFGQMAAAGMAGSALAGALNRGNRPAASLPPVPAKAAVDAAASAGNDNPVTGIAAEIREFAALRDAGMISDEEYAEQKHRLLGAARPPGPPVGSR